MATISINQRVLFGVKIKQLRQQLQLSFAELSEKSGMSISYLNEIEKGKKYPKDDKIQALAKALGTSFDYLTSEKLPKRLEPLGDLLNSNFLNELPLHLFGIDLSKIVDIIANAPTRVGAFIAALIDIAHKYELQQENFYFAALRAYQRLYDNYFEEWEQQVDNFARQYRISAKDTVSLERLYAILEEEFGCVVDKNILGDYPELRQMRSVYLPEENKLLVNSKLSPTQERFMLGKELAFQYLKIKDRILSSAVLRVRSFDEALHNFKASYFSVALLINREALASDLRRLFQQSAWDPQAFIRIMQKYEASPEMFLQRLTNILPRYFGMNDLFFWRFNNSIGQDHYVLTKELQLRRGQQLYGNEARGHYCRRWSALHTLQDLYVQQEQGDYQQPIASIQRSQYMDSGADYLCITLARPGHPTPNTNVSVTIGLAINEQLKRHIRFWESPNIPIRQVNQICERCAAQNCKERAAPPSILDKIAEQNGVLATLDALTHKKVEEDKLVE